VIKESKSQRHRMLRIDKMPIKVSKEIKLNVRHTSFLNADVVQCHMTNDIAFICHICCINVPRSCLTSVV